MKIKYSVIVPVYNAEGTIARCINSLVHSTRTDYEIIIVNDGATDRTKQICRNYEKCYSQISCIEKENGGVSSARNLGLSVAKGKYILFVDSDDYVCEKYFDELDNHLQVDCDFLMFGKVIYDGRKEKQYLLRERCTKNIESTMKLMSKVLTAQLLNSLWNKVFCGEIIRKYNLRFDESLAIGEDKVFVLQYIMHITNALFIKTPLYVVSVENEDSLSRKKREDLCEQIFREHRLLFETVENSDLSYESKKQLLGAVNYSYYRSAYTVISKLRKFNYSRKERLNKAKQICIIYSAKKNCASGNWKQWLISIPIKWKLVGIIDVVLRCIRIVN